VASAIAVLWVMVSHALRERVPEPAAVPPLAHGVPEGEGKE